MYGWLKHLLTLTQRDSISPLLFSNTIQLSLAPVNPFGFNLLGFTFLVPADPGGPGHIPDQQ